MENFIFNLLTFYHIYYIICIMTRDVPSRIPDTLKNLSVSWRFGSNVRGDIVFWCTCWRALDLRVLEPLPFFCSNESVGTLVVLFIENTTTQGELCVAYNKRGTMGIALGLNFFVIVESDSLESISYLRGKITNGSWEVFPNLTKSRKLKKKFQNCHWSWIPRSANVAANHLASRRCLEMYDITWVDRPHLHLFTS